MARSSSEVTVKLNVVSDISQAAGPIRSLQQLLSKIQLKPNQMGVADLQKEIKDITDQLNKIGKTDKDGNKIVNAAEVRQATGLIDELGRKSENLEKIWFQLSSVKPIELIPQSELEKINKLNKDVETYINSASRISKIDKAINLTKQLQETKGKDFTVRGKNSEAQELASLLKNLTGANTFKDIGINLKNPQEVLNLLNQMKVAASEVTFEKIVKDVNELAGTNLSTTTTSIGEIQKILNNLPEAKAQEIKDILKNMGDTATQGKENAKNLGVAFEEAGRGIDNLTSRQQELDRLTQSVEMFFGIQNMINLFKRGVREAIQVVQELDKAMAATAVVTDFTVNDMWKQLPTYQDIANKLGVTIKDVYEASTLYYQQGLNTKQVMEVTNQTLQMARIAGIDAAEATDMMTAALRGFNMEVNEANAQKVNDIFSELAAITASDTKELGTALEKTASIANSAGMSIEVTTALLAQAIEATREAPENIGTAMKTIIARFQELKKNPLTISEVDGETVDFNKVDTALKTIGVDLVESTDNFKNLDGVLLEISSRWDGLTQTQRRYIATIVAGSRQQSRFIAMMGDNARLTELVSHAYDSAGAAARQYEKTQQSLETAFNRVKNAWHVFLMGIANNQIIKTAAKALETIISVADKLFTVIGKLPGGFGTVTKSIAQLVASIAALKGARVVIQGLLRGFSDSWRGKSGGFLGEKVEGRYVGGLLGTFSQFWGKGRNKDNPSLLKRLFGKQKVIEQGAASQRVGWGRFNSERLGIDNEYNLKEKSPTGLISYFKNIGTSVKNGALAGAEAGIKGLTGSLGGLGKALGGAGGALKGFWTSLGTGGQIALIIAGITALIAVIQKFIKTTKQKIDARDNLFKQYTESLEDIQKNVDSVKDLEGEFKSLSSGVNEYGKNIGLSAEEYSKYNDIVNQLVKISPEIVQGYTKEGQAIIDKNTAIEKSLELLEKQRELEQAEFFSPTNIKTALEGYEGDLEQLAHDTEKSLGVTGVFQGENLSKSLDEYIGYYNNAIDQIEDENIKREKLRNVQLLESTKASLDNIYAQQANYLLEYANFLGIQKSLTSDSLSSYSSVLKSIVKSGDFTSADDAVFKALSVTKELENLKEYKKIQGEVKNIQKEYENEEEKTNEIIQEYNDNLNRQINELELLAQSQRAAGNEFIADAIEDRANALKDYKNEVFSVIKALNPLADAYSKAKNSAEDLKEALGSTTDNYTAQNTISEILDTVLDAERDDYGRITKLGKNESGHGSQSYWKAADFIIGRENLKNLNYDINQVDPLLYRVSKMMQGGQEGFDEFQKYFAEKIGVKTGQTLKEYLPNITTKKQLEEFAKELGLSTDAVAAMTSSARQFVNEAKINFSEVKQSYREGENVIQIGNAKTDQDFVLLSESQLYEDFQASGLNPGMYSDYLTKAQEAGIRVFTGADDFFEQYSAGITPTGETRDLVQFIQDANKTGQFNKEDLIMLGEKFLDKNAPLWAKQGQGIPIEDLPNIIDQITESDENFETIDLIKNDVSDIKNLLSAYLEHEGIYSEDAAKEVNANFDQIAGQTSLINPSSYSGEERTSKINELLTTYGDLKSQRDRLQAQYNKAVSKGDTETADRLKESIKKANSAIDTFSEKLGEFGIEDPEKALDNLTKAANNSAKALKDSGQNSNDSQTTYETTPDGMVVPVTVQPDINGEKAKKEANDLVNEIQFELDENGAWIAIDADNENAKYKIDETGKLLQFIDGQWVEPTISADNRGAYQRINETLGWMNKIPAEIRSQISVDAKLSGRAAQIVAAFSQLGGAGALQVMGVTPETLRIVKALQAAQNAGGSTSTQTKFINGPQNLGLGGGGGSGGSGGGGGGGGGSSSKSDTTPYSKDLSKIHNQLQRILYYNRLQEIAEAKYQSLITSHSTNPIQTLSKQIREERDAILSTINIQKGILKDEKKYTQTIISEINKDLKAAGGGSNIGKYLTIDTDRRMVQVTTAGLQATGEIKNAISAGQKLLEEWFSDVFDAEKGIYENTTQLNELRNTINQATGSFLDDLKNGIVDFRQDAIDRLSQINDTIDESNQKILDKTKESIDLQRQNRENDKKKQDLEDKRTRLSLLMQDTQGGHQVEIANLQKELAEGTQEFQDTLVDQKLDQITKANEEAKEQRERQINILQKQLDWSVDTGKIWDEIYKLWQNSMDSGSFDMSSTAAKYWLYGKDNAQQNLHNRKINWAELQKNSDDAVTGGVYSGHIMPGYTKSAGHYGSLTEMANAPELSGVGYGSTVTLSWDGKTVKGKIVKGNGGKAVIEAKNPTTGLTYKLNDWDVNKYGQDSETWVVNTGATDYRNQTNQLAFEQLKKSGGQLTFTDASGKTQTGTVMPDGSVKISKGAEFWTYTGLVADYSGNWSTKTKPQYQNFKDVQTVYDKIALAGYANTDWRDPKNPGNLWPEKIEKIIGAGNYKSRFLSRYNELKKNGTLEAWKKAGVEQWTYEILKDVMKNGKFIQYKTGGIADFTGPAWLDGTKSKPEMVLNQKDTQNFLQLKDILASIMKYNGLKSDSISNMNNSNSNYEININVDHLNSDYDVDKVAARVTKLITKSAAYRNPVKVTNYR